MTLETIAYTKTQLRQVMPKPAADDNKYTRGHLFVVAGCDKYPGAACLASTAAQRAGAGYTQVVCAPETVPIVRMTRPSLVVESWEGWSASSIPATTEHHPTACAMGSGFDGADFALAALTLDALAHVQAPLLIDGGAITALASPEGLAAAQKREYPLVITPHGGEAARLAKGAGSSQNDALALAKALANAYHAVVVLKGPDTFISDGEVVVAMTQGTPALAKAGTGDVLAGIIGALLAQGVGPLDAGVLGATIHAEAGVIASRDGTELSVIPEDVVAAIPYALKL